MTTKTAAKSKHILGKALCQVLGIQPTLTRTGNLSTQTCKELNKAGYYWFPGRRVWDKLNG